MKISQIHTDENGFARGFAHHDGFLDAVVCPGAGQDAQLAIRSSNGERRIIVLTSVDALSVDGFREGNIILSIQLLSAAAAVKLAHIETLLTERFSRDIKSVGAMANVFLLETSYGAQVVAICANALVSEVGMSLGPVF